MRIAIIAIIASLFVGTGGAAADPASDADKAMFQQIISAQMSAFQADDAAGAFDFASPDLQAKFGSAATFLEMVKSGYAPVYRPRTVEFRDIVEHDIGPEQRVFVIGPDGRSYIAHYMMEKQPDGSWRISGCYLDKAGDESV
nr:DUF4864 domain-containing protein [uncultured Dongia sp.]